MNLFSITEICLMNIHSPLDKNSFTKLMTPAYCSWLFFLRYKLFDYIKTKPGHRKMALAA